MSHFLHVQLRGDDWRAVHEMIGRTGDYRLAVNETFYSIQGEGYWMGTPAYFIRLQGCTVGC